MADRHLFTLKHDDSSVWESDSIEIFLDADASRHRYAQLMLNTAGAYCDLMVDKASTKHDLSYESNAKVLYGTRDNAWTMEVAFPLESLGNARKYGFDICRSRVLKNDNSVARYYQWTPFARRYGDVENFGTISFDAIESKNLIDNASFDKPQKGRWFGKWNCEQKHMDSKQVSLDKSIFMFGGQSLKLEGKYSPNYKEWVTVGQYLDGIKPNTKYRLTAYLKIDAKEPSQKGSVFFFFNDGVNHQLPKAGGIRETIPWTAFVFDFTTRDNITKRPYLRLYNSLNGTAWLDGVILQELE